MHRYQEFFQALQYHGLEYDTRKDENVGNFRRSLLDVIRIRNREQVHILIREANHYRVSLFPISRGSNWGYGSQLPIKNESVLVDLSALNRIVHIDAELGTATIEPGVTQEQLAREIATSANQFILDVTGSGTGTSVLGNALERGIAYHGLRASQVLALEVLLGNGTLLRTGFGHLPHRALSALYPYGLGPSLDGLFFQSNFGIVLEGSIQLTPKPETVFTVGMSIFQKDLPELIQCLRSLKRKGCLQGIPHLADRERMLSTLVPLVQKNNLNLSYEDVLQSVKQALPQDWFLTAAIHGDRQSAWAKRKRVKKELQHLGKLYFHSETEMSLQARLREKLLFWLATPVQRQVLQASQTLRGLHYGRPTDAGIYFLTEGGKSSVDANPKGFLLCTPLAPLQGENACRFNHIAHMIATKHKLPIAMTLNLISDRVLEAVISVHFARNNKAETERAHLCILEMTRAFNQQGFYPYRINIDLMDELICSEDPYWQTIHGIKQQLDPLAIIAPGRYA